MPLRFVKNNAKTSDSRFRIADELAKLTNLKVQGMITEEEFIEMKQELKSQNYNSTSLF